METGKINKLKAQSVSSSSKFIFLASLFVFIFLFTISSISAVPPVQSTIVAPQGLEIESTNFDYMKQNDYHVFRFRVYNSSNNIYMNDTHINCSMGIIDDKGDYVHQQAVVTASGYVFSVNVTEGNFSRLGIYHKGINCITNDGITAGGVLTQSFEVTPTGFTGTLGFYILILILSFGIIIFGYVAQDGWVAILGAFGFILMGLFMLLFGIDGIKDSVYTYGISIITIMVGSYIGIRAAIDQI